MGELIGALIAVLAFGIMFGSLVVEDNRRHPPLRSPDGVDPSGRQEKRHGKAQAEEKGP